MVDPLIILAALICGMLSRALGLPALLGYLAAGFVLHELDVGGGEMQFFARLLAILKNREVSLGKEWILCALFIREHHRKRETVICRGR